MHSVPAVVAAAIENYNSENGKVLRPPSRKERSFIFNWGVRVGSEANKDPVLKWICLASQTCREQHRSFTLSGGKTSKAAKHLREAHGVECGKTLAQAERKRLHDEEMASMRRSPLFRNDPAQAYLLLETCQIVNNNLPFCLGEYEESLAIRDLVYKDAMQVTVNAKAVHHAIIELYASTKTEIIAMIAANHIGSAKTFTIVAELWTSKPKATKFLGLRLYLVDAQFRFKSILLGTRHFKPLYGDRDGGIRSPFQRWIVEILREFGLSQHDVHGSTTDGGSDVKWMMQEGLKLSWEWCLPHLTHAATKWACGMVNSVSTSKNPRMTALISRVVNCVYQTKQVEVMGSLFQELSVCLGDSQTPTQLLDYKAHRFLGLTRVIRRVLLLWDPFVLWYEERANKARRQNLSLLASFPLFNDKLDLIQILSLLEPITSVAKLGQSEKSNQADVLMALYTLRFSALDVTAPLKDCRSTDTSKRFFRPEELSVLVSHTRELLHASFHKRFFKRYTDQEVMEECSYAFEMQFLLHPHYKKRVIYDKIRKVMAAVDTQLSDSPSSSVALVPPPAVLFSDEVAKLLAETIAEWQQTSVPMPSEISLSRIEEELDRWRNSNTRLQTHTNGEFEDVLGFWYRQSQERSYRILPLAVRVIFSMPSSSAQLERDFGVAGMMVRTQRSSLTPHNIDMATFLNCNRDYVDITQCAQLKPEVARENTPASVLLELQQEFENDVGALDDLFSQASVELDEETKENE